MKRKHLLSMTLGILFLISSCNTSSSVESTPTPWIPSTSTPVPTPTSRISPTLIPTQAFPILSVQADVPCRAGPGDIYDLVVNLRAGMKVEIVGKAETFWLVKHSPVTKCWVADQQVNIEGDISAIPNVTPPPAPVITPQPPAAPANITYKVTCKLQESFYKYVDEVQITWTDMSNNEDGFRVYRDGNVAAIIPANKTTVVVASSMISNKVHSFYVTAFNSIGESKYSKSESFAIFCRIWE